RKCGNQKRQSGGNHSCSGERGGVAAAPQPDCAAGSCLKALGAGREPVEKRTCHCAIHRCILTIWLRSPISQSSCEGKGLLFIRGCFQGSPRNRYNRSQLSEGLDE